MSLLGFKARTHPQQGIYIEEVNDRALPPAEFWVLNRRFNFSIDVAATCRNAKLPRFVTRERDGLSISWAGERVYCNPPFSEIRPWVEKAWSETDAELAVLLLPASRTEQPWWQQLIEPRRDREGSQLRVEFLPNRLRFIKPDRVTVQSNSRAPFGCCLCIWNWNP